MIPRMRLLFRIAEVVRQQLTQLHQNLITDITTAPSQIDSFFEHIQHQRRLLRRCIGESRFISALVIKGRLEKLLGEMHNEIESAKWAFSRPLPVLPTVVDIVRDLDHLRDEFDPWQYHAEKHALCVTTMPITLEDVYLGRFEVQLFLLDLPRCRSSQIYSVTALDPNPAESAEHVTHPHVNDGALCAGDATSAIGAALESGRLLDFFQIINSVLHTYNPESPYVSLDDWNGCPCGDCGHLMHEDDRYTCEICEDCFCESCVSHCRCCDCSICLEHIGTCPQCEESVCRDCMTGCDRCESTCCNDCQDDGLCPACTESMEYAR